MTLEDAIQQKRPFRNQHHKVMVNLLYTNNWLEEKSRDFLKQQNVSLQQYNILRILKGSVKPLSTMQIRERMLDRMSDTSRIVERMVSKGLVQKAISEKDKRMVDVIITPQGAELLENLDRRNEELDAVVNHLSDQELETLNNLLDKLRNNH